MCPHGDKNKHVFEVFTRQLLRGRKPPKQGACLSEAVLREESSPSRGGVSELGSPVHVLGRSPSGSEEGRVSTSDKESRRSKSQVQREFGGMRRVVVVGGG